ncbi:D-alanyl-D-alanine carboxypeptidase family protein [Oceanicella actignis]|uniref:D-alanyl-D-alanine carboxypeptidase n=1 Tax=Oceanicella actignis TaxID=1189325 RepID=A0A1M7TNE8_9RHOB|nr:D-alanyl-D-alanine carboxypeptidase [Oceanicella actignis]SHN72188.1 D-alanyl-D-alanine carboxypeptidase [Oceanicella actignis]
MIKAARRLMLGAFVAAAALLGALAPEARAAQYAALVMDARTGEVLYARNADTPLPPASLTKMMTIYLAIEAVKSGRLKLDQKVRVSALAARQPPSRIGLRPGQLVRVRDLIRAAAVKSANDAAMALAEAVGGSKERFAQMMNRKAKALGMTRTNFRNPHGLTEAGHLSTARDMAILGRRLFFDHPEYYNIFGRKKTRAVGRTIYATNRRLLSSYAGADGIKTGYTAASGYNLVASAHRGEKRVIVSVFGARSSRQRTQKVAQLLDLGFKRAPRDVAVIRPGAPTGRVARAPAPALRPTPPAGLLAQLGEAVVPAAAAAELRASRSRAAPLRAEFPPDKPGGGVAVASQLRMGAVSPAAALRAPAPRPRPR